MDTGASFGRWVALRRKALRLSQSEVARQANCAVVTLRKIEDDTRRPSQQLAECLVKSLAVLASEHDWFIQAARGERCVDQLSSPDKLNGAQLLAMYGTGQNPWPTHLPIAPTPLIGRAADAASAQEILLQPDVRLLTLIGTPGIGKTRLALQVATDISERGTFPDGVYFVPLAVYSDAGRVPNAIAEALSVSVTPGLPVLDGVKRYLRDKSLLLVLDNFEHILDATPCVAELLLVAPGLKVLATSRAALRLSGEHLFDVSPLVLPPLSTARTKARALKDPAHESSELTGYSAVKLFVQRARAVMPGFVLTGDNSVVVIEICRRLDGLPLAIELAAVRARLLSLDTLLVHLTTPPDNTQARTMLDVLGEGPRDLPPRQRTLRNAIAWSYNLLTQSQQRLLRCFGVFVGGCTLEAAHIVAGHPPNFLADLQTLLDSSLIQRSDPPESETRFTLLEMIREYALEQLEAHSETEDICCRHAQYYLKLLNSDGAGDAEHPDRPGVWPGLISPKRTNHFVEGVAWIKRMQPEYPNLLASLTWSLSDAGDENTGIDLIIGLFNFWGILGIGHDGIEWIKRALTRAEPSARTQVRARLLCEWACFADGQSDYAQAEALAKEALAIHRELQDRMDIVCALLCLSSIELNMGKLVHAQMRLEECVAISLELKKNAYASYAQFILGHVALQQGDIPRALQAYEACLETFRVDDERDVVALFHELGKVECIQGNFERAAALHTKSLKLWQDHQASGAVADALHGLGDVALFRGDLMQAKSLFEESLLLRQEVGSRRGVIACLAGLAALAATEGHAERAVTLWVAAEAIRIALGDPRPTLRYKDYSERVDAMRGQLDEQDLNAAIATGCAMTLDQAVEYALLDE